MLHVIPYSRLAHVEPFEKAADMRPHKYLKRERTYVRGKPTWRYWYKDDKERQRYKGEHDPGDEHEHIVTSEASKIYKNLGKRRRPTSQITTGYLSNIIKAPVRFSATFVRSFSQEFINAEKKGVTVERNPLQRVADAVELLPQSVKDLTRLGGLHLVSRSDPTVREQFENEDPPRPVPAAWTDKEGNVYLAADGVGSAGVHGFNTVAQGEPGFGRSLTLSEELLWHEIGEALREAVQRKRRPILDAWKVVSDNPRLTRISAASGQNWKVDFAESFAAMMAHPKQMAEQCPERYDFFREHFFGHLPERAEMRKRATREFAWWEAPAQTNAHKLYLQMTEAASRAPESARVPYRSSKDEFYSVTVEGRTVYFRVGPPTIHDEDLWTPMPEVLDKVTGLPTFDKDVASRFRAKGIVKEAYDEFGNVLDDTSAWLYLNQDQDVVALDLLDAYNKLPLKDKATHGLGYHIFIKLGENRGDPKKEREAVAKYKAQGKLMEERGDRYQWAPVKIDEGEFQAKTPSFLFHRLREADRQPYELLENGRPIIDPRSKKPVLAARVYEAIAASGTRAQIVVQESPEFAYGDTVMLPVREQLPDEASGQVRSVTSWQSVTLNLREHKDKSAVGLAKKYSTTLAEVLHHNNKFGQWQIQDPIMAALINPEARQISSREDLISMLKFAAEAKPERWVTIQVSSDVPPSTVHAKVRFDGAGSPLFVGDYWQRKLGMPNPRVSDLIAAGKLKGTDRVVERRPVRKKIELGHIVYAKIEDRMVLARLEERVSEEGKITGYRVAPLPNQKLEGTAYITGLIRSVPDTVDPDRPTIRLRHIRSPMRDIVLYGDEIQLSPTGAPIEGSGVVKIGLPSNGLVGFEEIVRAPGVRVKDGDLILDASQIDRFREHVGGFVMDHHVQAKLERQMREARLREQAAKEKRVQISDLADDKGLPRVDGLLKGMRANVDGQPFWLGQHRAEMLQALAQTGGRLIAAHHMGCLSGDTMIPVNRAGKGYSIAIQKLHEKWITMMPGGKRGRYGAYDSSITTYAHSLVGDFLRLNDVLAVVDSGMKTTYLVRTKNGREIRATEEHPFWTTRGWVCLSDLRYGDLVCVEGAVEPTGRASKKIYLYNSGLLHHPFAGIRGAKASPYRVVRHRLVMEAHLNGLTFKDFTSRCRDGNVAVLRFLDPAVWAVHHKNGNHLDNDIINLQLMSHVEHWKSHGEEDGWTNFNQMKVGTDKVEFVGDEKDEQTYDIVMNPCSQSYVANEFVVHNTGKTISSIAGIKMMQNLTGRPKRVLVVAPKPVVSQWEKEVKDFTTGRATVIGPSDIPGAVQMWSLPDRLKEKPPDWTEQHYAEELAKVAKQAQDRSATYWRPDTDNTDIVVVSQEYFTKHESELRRIGKFDGMVVDETQGIQYEDNKRSEAVARWNSDLNFMMLLSGTPVTNRLNTLSQYLRLVSGGEVDLGSREDFERDHMVESSVLKAAGAKTATKMDLNPTRLSEILPHLQRYIHVVTSADVKGNVMPSVLLDENKPAQMTPIQSIIYRGYMRQLSADDKTMLEAAASLGEDERKVLREDGRRTVRVGRNVANTPGYKPPDNFEFVTYKVAGNNIQLRLPSWGDLAAKFKGKFPGPRDVESGRMSEEEYGALAKWFGHALDVDYDTIAGRSASAAVTASQLKLMKAGEPLESGIQLGAKIVNPEYGPEGAICRGRIIGGRIVPLEHSVRNESGKIIDTVVVPPGYRFVRDPRRKSEGKYFAAGLPDSHPDAAKYPHDWDYSREVIDAVESGTSGEETGSVRGVERGQAPKEGHEQFDLNTSVHRRRERTMLDMVLTDGNSKTDAMEEWVRANTNPKLGGDPDAQHVIFGGAIGSACRTVEAKLRMMGYKDVNEALNDDLRAREDRPPSTGKYFVSYIGGGATLGDRDINSEIFRRAVGDQKTSMLVQRILYGTSAGRLKEGVMDEGWQRDQRDTIKSLFTGVEVPARVAVVNDGGKSVHRYAYDSDVNRKDRHRLNELEDKLRVASDKAVVRKEMDEVYRRYLVDRVPLTQRQIDVFNNCQFMVASDAAQVGLNWGNAAYLGMYDSIFSPMAEWQRITRIARVMREAVPTKLQSAFDKLEKKVHAMGAETNFSEYDGEADSAIRIVSDAINQLPNVREELRQAKINDAQFAETYLAQRSLDRIDALRPSVEQKLRVEGRIVTSAPKVKVGEDEAGKPIYDYQKVKATEVTSADVMNEILEKHLRPFEREILRSRRYMKDVKRFLASVDTPEMKRETIVTEEGKKKRVMRPTGRIVTEMPCNAEKAVLTRSRAKQVPVERFLTAVQSERTPMTSFDFLPATIDELSKFGEDVKPPPTKRELELERARRRELQQVRREERARARRIAIERRERERKERAAKVA